MYVWQQIGNMKKEQDNQLVSLNKADFNAAFLAYEKNLMYGTDVLSCLNKAQNNNQRYIYNNYYGTDNESVSNEARSEYFIDVIVKTNSTLSENLSVYYRNSNGSTTRLVGLGPVDKDNKNFHDTSSGNNTQLFKNTSSGSAKESIHFDLPTIYYYYFEKGIVKKEAVSYGNAMWTGGKMTINKTIYELISDSANLETGFKKGEYHLLDGAGIENYTTSAADKRQAAQLSALLSTVTTMEQTKINSNWSVGRDNWYSATWKTAAYDFKTRKFKCTKVDYNDDTGYVCAIYFEEI